jgi:uncharacterized protein YqgC (DUF456 family)
MIGLSIELLVALGFAAFGLLSVGLVVVGLPGAWLLIAAAVAIDLLQSLWMPAGAPLVFHPLTIAAAVAVAALGEVLELTLSAAGARRFGASRAGMIGSVIGGVLGALIGTCAIPLPVIGTIAGALLGTATGAVLGELAGGKKSLKETTGPATGAVVGRVLGTLAKLPCAAAVLVILGVAAFA